MHWPRAFRTASLLGLCLCLRAQAQEFADQFADRGQITTAAGTLAGNTSGATREPNEPRHGDHQGGHSVWVSWIAPTNGIATLRTDAAGFDTLIAVYRLRSGDDPVFDRLREVTDDDDSGGERRSLAQFGVESGRQYEIAVDGYGGETGAFTLSWTLESSAVPVPVLLLTPGSQSLQLGDTLRLSVDVQSVENMELQWFFNNRELEEEEASTLVISNLQPAHLGQYRLRLGVESARFFGPSIEIQINTEGDPAALARDKPLDALNSRLTTSPPAPVPPELLGATPALSAPPPGVVSGYSGTQIFNTQFALRDPAEPIHCGLAGGATYWFAYQPPEIGLLKLDTTASTYDTLLAVYTYDPPLRGFQDLIEVACNDNVTTNDSTSRVEFGVSPDRTYLVVVDGVDGARGIVHLNYLLTTGTATNAFAPVIVEHPHPTAATPGRPARFNVQAFGSPPLRYQWFKDGQPVSGATNRILLLDPTSPLHLGTYSAVVRNDFGSITSAVGRLLLVDAPHLDWNHASPPLEVRLPALTGARYTLESSTTLPFTNWLPVGPSIQASSNSVSFSLPTPAAGLQFFRVRAE